MTRILNNHKALLFIIAILLVANIAMLVFFIGLKPPGRKNGDHNDQDRPRVSEFLKKEVKFNDQQLRQYDSLKWEHWSALKPMFKGMNLSKDSFYSHLSDVTIDSAALKTISDSIALRQKALDMQVFKHFRNIRSLCTPEQLPAFDSSVQEVIRVLINPYRKKETRHKATDRPARDKA